MRIERVQHIINRRFKQIVIIEFFAADVIIFNHRQCFGDIFFNVFSRHRFDSFGGVDFGRRFGRVPGSCFVLGKNTGNK